MTTAASRSISHALKACACVCAGILFLFGASLLAKAQEAEFTQNKSGSHAMTLEVPLTNYPGRGVSVPVRLTYSTSGLWRIGFINSVPIGSSVWRSVTEAIYAEHSTAGWTTSLDVPKVEWPRQNDVYWYTGKAYSKGTVPPYTYRIAQLFMHMPDGSTHEMRKTDTVYPDGGSIDMSGTFYSVDSSRMRYDSTGQNTGTLFLPDGSRYFLGSTTVQFIDRNGNTLNYDIASRQWTDTMGRAIGMPWPVNPGPGDYTYSVPALNNTTVSYTIKFRSLSNALTPGSPSLKAVADYYLPNPSAPPTGSGGTNFPQSQPNERLFFSVYSDPEETSQSFTYVVGRDQPGGTVFNPTVMTEIVMPTGLSYKFSYNIYGELDKVIYPTGGYQRYQYGNVSTIGVASDPYTEGSRGMLSRTISPSGTGTDEATWQYSGGNSPMTITSPDGTRNEIYLYYSLTNFDNQFGYQDARQGSVVEERTYAPVSQGGAMLRRTLYSYGITTSITNKPVPPNTFNSGTYTAYRNPRLEKTVTILLDTGGDALAKTVTYGYIDNGLQFSTGLDQNSATETHFQSVNQTSAQNDAITLIPAGTTASRVDTTYLSNSSYQTRNILGLPTSVTVKGMISGVLQTVARTDNVYDEVAYPLLNYGDLAAPDYTDPFTTARGNVTTTKRYTDIALNLHLDTHQQFDQCGNLRVAYNERNLQTQTDYSSTYKHAYPTQVTTPVPDPTGAHGSTFALISSSTFDYTTGLPLTTTDPNGQVTSMSYKDDLDVTDPLTRLRKVTRPDGGWTKYTYGDSVGNLFKLTDTKQDATRTLKTYEYFDPMGRISRSFLSEGGTTYITTDTLYDQMGRASKVSHPYRTDTLGGAADITHTSNWTTSSFDPLGRIVSVTYPDSSLIQTAYQGIYTTVTDQTGRQRRQKSDALGRVIRVDEPNASGSLGTVDSPAQATSFEYDTQGNLVHVAQGASPVQHRYFKYDALGRPTYERQVEHATAFTATDAITGNSSWTRKMIYDETFDTVAYSGLLTTAQDARTIQTQFRYDNLNRTFQINYTDGTPTITNKYDQAVTGYFNKGRMTETSTAAVGAIPTTSQVYNFDLMGRLVNNQQTVGAQGYIMSYTYNLAGALTSQTYPSGRTVSYGFDEGARLSQVSSGATIYAHDFDYTSTSGLLKSVTLGNDVVETYTYNSRLQIQNLALTRTGTQLLQYDYKYGVYDPNTNTLDESKNNGQIAQIEGFIATQKQWQQRFAYDSIGRLASTREFRGDNGQQSYVVNYDYDVFGNRYQKQTQNPSNPFAPVWVEAAHIDQATNRFNSNVTYDNTGNVTVDSKFRLRKFQYDANNRLKQTKNLDDTNAVDSIFVGKGQRVAIQVGGSLTSVLVYDGMGKLLAEYNTTTLNGGTQYNFTDQQGTPRLVTSNQGSVISRHDYLPYGDDVLNGIGMRSSGQGYGGPETSRQKYTGMEKDEASGLSHTLWREYDSSSGRWTAPDPYGGSMTIGDPQSFNRYSYALNNPVNGRDPSGLMTMIDASWSWGDVSGLWAGGSLGFGGPETGRSIIAARQAERDVAIQARIDGKLAQSYLNKGNISAALRIFNNNSNVGLYVNGRALWGSAAADYASVTVTAIVNPVTATVHFWAPTGNSVKKGNVGHLSVSFSNGVYISFWPQRSPGVLGILIWNGDEPGLLQDSLQADINAEGGNPTESFEIANVDGGAVQAFYQQLSASPGRWTIDRNCADVVAQAMQVAGLIITNTQNGNSTPREVLNLIKAASASGARYCPDKASWQGKSSPLRYPK
jgi:RHS repeat-associated protein